MGSILLNLAISFLEQWGDNWYYKQVGRYLFYR